VTDTTSSGPAAETPAADAQFITDTTSSGPAQTAAEAGGGTAFVTDTTSSGPAAETPAAEAQFITDTTSSGPAQTTAEASGGGGGSSWVATDAGEAALAGGLVLLIAAAGFTATRHRTTPPKPA
jgi:hypothetical protein